MEGWLAGVPAPALAITALGNGGGRAEREAAGKRKGGGGQPSQQKPADVVSLQKEGMDLLIASARLAQRVARAQRQHAAALEHVVLLPLEHALVAPMLQQEDRWHQAQRGQLAVDGTKMEMPGGLSLYLWAAAVTRDTRPEGRRTRRPWSPTRRGSGGWRSCRRGSPTVG